MATSHRLQMGPDAPVTEAMIEPRPGRSPGPRSVATTERILAAAELLLRKHGEKFTLGDVASAGRVSMASIYGRYPSKVHLVREVQARVLDGLTATIRNGLLQIESEGGDLEWRTARVIDIYAEAHRARAAIIRAFHAAAREDTALRARGVTTVAELVELATGALRGCGPVGEPSLDEATLRMIIQVFLHALSNYLGFGHHGAADGEAEWLAFKETITRMVYVAVHDANRPENLRGER